MDLNPETFPPAGIDRFHAYLAEERAQIAAGPWFGDSAHVIRIGLVYESAGKLELGLEVISAALETALRRPNRTILQQCQQASVLSSAHQRRNSSTIPSH